MRTPMRVVKEKAKLVEDVEQLKAETVAGIDSMSIEESDKAELKKLFSKIIEKIK